MGNPALSRLVNQFLKIAKDPSAGYLIFCPEDGTVFLTKRSKKQSSPGKYDIGGGRPDDDDDGPKETARREFLEELGKLPSKRKIVGKHTIENDKHHYIIYLVAISKAEKKKWTKEIKLDEETESCDWYPFDKLPSPTHLDFTWVEKELKKWMK